MRNERRNNDNLRVEYVQIAEAILLSGWPKVAENVGN